MDLASEAASIRRQVARNAERRYPPELVAEVRRFVVASRAAGVSMARLSEQLGIPLDTLYRWQRATPPVRSLRPVEVIADERRVTVLGPCGVRIEGLALDGVAALLRKLA